MKGLYQECKVGFTFTELFTLKMANFVACELSSQFLKKSMHVIHHINRKRGKSPTFISTDAEKAFLQNPAGNHDKVSQRMRNMGKFLQSDKRHL